MFLRKKGFDFHCGKTWKLAFYFSFCVEQTSKNNFLSITSQNVRTDLISRKLGQLQELNMNRTSYHNKGKTLTIEYVSPFFARSLKNVYWHYVYSSADKKNNIPILKRLSSKFLTPKLNIFATSCVTYVGVLQRNQITLGYIY